jgi:AmmeMemoRadiSam system protein B
MGKSYDRVILLGPSHAVGFSSAALDCQRLWQTPIGTVPLDRNAIAQLSKFDGFEILPQVFDKEHSIEVQLPFLQTVLSDFSLIPICCGQDLPHKQIAEALETVRTNATLVIASSDFSHYHPEVEANKLDHLSVASILSQNPVFIQKNTDACGKEGIQILNSLARANRWKPVLLDYQTSGNITHDYSAVVGYASFAYV